MSHVIDINDTIMYNIEMNKEVFKELVQTIGYNNAIEALKIELNFKTNLNVEEFILKDEVLLKTLPKRHDKLIKYKTYNNALNASRKGELKAKDKRLRLEKFQKEVINEIPESEQWFRPLFEAHFKLPTDKYNQKFKGKFLPDVLNTKFKYVIEIDGSMHNLVEIIQKDKTKNAFYKRHGYRVFRIKPYAIDQYIQLVRNVCFYRKNNHKKEFDNFLKTY